MISVITATASPEIHAASERHVAQLLQGGPSELIFPQEITGLAHAFNQGAAKARGELLIFWRGQVEFLADEFLADDFRSKLIEHMEHCDLLAISGTTMVCGPHWLSAGLPHVYGQVAVPNPKHAGWLDVLIWSAPQRRSDGMQGLDGTFLCFRRQVFESLQFDTSFTGKSLYDIDYTYRAHRNGFRLSVANDLYPIRTSLPGPDADWPQSEAHFEQKYRGQLPIHLRQRFQTGVVSVSNRRDILEVMTPPHWDMGHV